MISELCSFQVLVAAIKRCRLADETMDKLMVVWSTVSLSKNVPPLACYNLDIYDPIAIVFGRGVTEKVGNQTMLCFLILPI